jgi:hypothetical protein
MPADPIYCDEQNLIPAWEAEHEYGVPQQVIRKWASRGKINRFPGQRNADGTWYDRFEVATMAARYKATPQRAPRAA